MEMTRKNVSPSGLMTLEQTASIMNLSVGQVKNLRRCRRLAFIVNLGKLYSRQQWIDEYYEREKDI